MNIRMIIIAIILSFIILISEYVTYAIYRHADIIKSTKLEVMLMILGITLPILFIVSMAYGFKHFSIFNSLINTISAVWLGLLLYTFIASLIVFVFIIVNSYFGLNLSIKIISIVMVCLALMVVSYGVWNANNIKIVRLEVKSEKLSKDWSNKKIVIISDVHLGQMRKDKYLKNIISKIEIEKPDVVFILGDLIDGSVIPYDKWLNEFSSLKSEFGNIYVEGNHEKYSQEYNTFKSAIPESLINLTNKKVIINNTQIIGLDYIQGESLTNITAELKSLNYDATVPSIILIHDPKNVANLSTEKVSLVLSGHTHGGQLFPFTILLKSLYKKYIHGVTYTESTASVTSSGVGTSIIPLRVGTTPEIIVLTIK